MDESLHEEDFEEDNGDSVHSCEREGTSNGYNPEDSEYDSEKDSEIGDDIAVESDENNQFASVFSQVRNNWNNFVF